MFIDGLPFRDDIAGGTESKEINNLGKHNPSNEDLHSSIPLTSEYIGALQPHEKEHWIHDEICPDLCIRCRPKNVRQFYYWGNIETGGWGDEIRKILLGSIKNYTLAHARGWARQYRILEPFKSTEHPLSPDTPINTLITEYLLYQASMDRDSPISRPHSMRTQRLLEQHVNLQFSGRLINSVSRKEWLDYLTRQKMELGGQGESAHKAIKAFLNWCTDRGVIYANPLQKTQVRFGDSRVYSGIGVSNLKNIFQSCEEIRHPASRIIQLAITTGENICLICKAHSKAINLDDNCWHVEYHDSYGLITPRRTIPITEAVRPLLRPVIGSPYLFPSLRKKGGHMTVSAEYMAKLSEQVGLRKKWTMHQVMETVRSQIKMIGGLHKWSDHIIAENRQIYGIEDEDVVL